MILWTFKELHNIFPQWDSVSHRDWPLSYHYTLESTPPKHPHPHYYVINKLVLYQFWMNKFGYYFHRCFMKQVSDLLKDCASLSHLTEAIFHVFGQFTSYRFVYVRSSGFPSSVKTYGLTSAFWNAAYSLGWERLVHTKINSFWDVRYTRHNGKILLDWGNILISLHSWWLHNFKNAHH